MTGNLRPAFRHTFRCGRLCVADRLQQCRESAVGPFQRPPPRDRVANGDWGRPARVSFRLFVFESLLVSLLAGIVGALLAWQLVPLVPKMAANFLPLDPKHASALSLSVLGFTFGVSLVTGLLMGIYPALQSSRADLVDGLKEGGRGTSGSVRQQRFRKIFVGAQVALSVTLLAGAALLITSFIRLTQQNLGFQPEIFGSVRHSCRRRNILIMVASAFCRTNSSRVASDSRF